VVLVKITDVICEDFGCHGTKVDPDCTCRCHAKGEFLPLVVAYSADVINELIETIETKDEDLCLK
jgi:hypothetical protein